MKQCSHHPALLQLLLLQPEVKLQLNQRAANADEQLNAAYKLCVIARAVWCHLSNFQQELSGAALRCLLVVYLLQVVWLGCNCAKQAQTPIGRCSVAE